MKLLTRMGALLIAGTAAGCSASTAPADEVPRSAEVAAPIASVRFGDVATAFEAGGVVRARLAASIASRVLAPVVEVAVVPGDRVRRGQMLVRLDGRELDANRTRAEAAVAAAEQAVNQAAAGEQMAQAALHLASATHERMATLREKRSATPQELDQAVAGLRAAGGQVEVARARAQQAASALEAARAGAEAARVAASYAALTAPFDGVVTTRAIDPGTVAVPGVPLMTVEDTSALRLEIPLDEARASAVHVGQEAQVRFDSGRDPGEEEWTSSRVVEVARIDPVAHSFLVKLDVTAPAGVSPGSFGRARFAGHTRPGLTVPATAVVRRGQLVFVFVVDEQGVARLRPVNPGPEIDGRVELLAGVRDGERVVSRPPASLADGTPIRDAGEGGPQ